MGEYIDREAMLEQIARRESLMVGDKMISIDALRAFIMNHPVADVEEVKYGEWIYDSNTDEPRCSECGEDAIAETVSPYCPWCGAKCEEEDKNNGTHQ